MRSLCLTSLTRQKTAALRDVKALQLIAMADL